MKTIYTEDTIDHGHILIDDGMIQKIRENINQSDIFHEEIIRRCSHSFPREPLAKKTKKNKIV